MNFFFFGFRILISINRVIFLDHLNRQFCKHLCRIPGIMKCTVKTLCLFYFKKSIAYSRNGSFFTLTGNPKDFLKVIITNRSF
mgnify:CR=1 FL=1